MLAAAGEKEGCQAISSAYSARSSISSAGRKTRERSAWSCRCASNHSAIGGDLESRQPCRPCRPRQRYRAHAVAQVIVHGRRSTCPRKPAHSGCSAAPTIARLHPYTAAQHPPAYSCSRMLRRNSHPRTPAPPCCGTGRACRGTTPTRVRLLPHAAVQVVHRQQRVQVVGVRVQQRSDVVGVKGGLALLVQLLHRLPGGGGKRAIVGVKAGGVEAG